MFFWSHFRCAIQALRVTKIRSALTMLGIIIGVAAVIVVMAVGAGAKQRVVEQLQSLGANLIVVLPGSAKQSGALLGHGTERSLTEGDAEAPRRFQSSSGTQRIPVVGTTKSSGSRKSFWMWKAAISLRGELFQPSSRPGTRLTLSSSSSRDVGR